MTFLHNNLKEEVYVIQLNEYEKKREKIYKLKKALYELKQLLKEMNTHAILCCLVKLLNYVVYEHILIKRVTEEVERMLIAVNVNRVFTQSLTLILFHFIEVAKTSLLNTFT